MLLDNSKECCKSKLSCSDEPGETKQEENRTHCMLWCIWSAVSSHRWGNLHTRKNVCQWNSRVNQAHLNRHCPLLFCWLLIGWMLTVLSLSYFWMARVSISLQVHLRLWNLHRGCSLWILKPVLLSLCISTIHVPGNWNFIYAFHKCKVKLEQFDQCCFINF